MVAVPDDGIAPPGSVLHSPYFGFKCRKKCTPFAARVCICIKFSHLCQLKRRISLRYMSLLLYLQLFCGFEAAKRENAKNVFPCVFPLQLFDFLNIAFHPLRARSLHIIGDMAVYIKRESSCMMPKVALHGLDVIACPKRGDGIAVPIGYNRDKHKISRGSWGFSDLSLFFSEKRPRNRGFPRGAKVVTSCKGQNLFAAQEETDMK